MKYVFRGGVELLIISAGLALAVCCLSSGQAFNQVVLQTKEASDRTGGGTFSEDTDCLNPELRLPRHYIRSDGLLNRKAVLLPQPTYPERAKVRGGDGVVRVNVVVDENGKVIWARIRSGQSVLRKAVAGVVCRARFTPPVNGNVKVRGDIVYKLALPKRVPPDKSFEPTPN